MNAGLRDLKATAVVSFIPLWRAAIDFTVGKSFTLQPISFFG
jgi:hypothetical protein